MSPRVFVASASEHRQLVDGLRRLNTGGSLRYAPWTNLGAFPPSEYILDSLLNTFSNMDGAVLLSFGVDKTWWREHERATPRDNVVLEAGIAFALFGRKRTVIVTDSDVSLPSDLYGLGTIKFQPSGRLDDDISDLHSHLSAFFKDLATGNYPLRRLWSGSDYSLVVHSFKNPEKGELEEIVNINAVRALGHLTDCLSRLGHKWSLVSSRGDTVPVTDNLVLVGSAASNRITKRLVEQFEERVRFVAEFDPATMGTRHIRDRASGTLYAPEVADKEISVDYGILTKMRNPNDTTKWAIVMEGNYGSGTCGAAMLTIDSVALESMSIPLEGQFQALVEVPVFGRFVVGKPKVIASEVIPD